MKENYEICHCMGVTYFDVEDALSDCDRLEDVVALFDKVQQATHCSTGCGGCHDDIMKTISQIMMA